ncbi:MAG: hypothetical protein LBB95_02000 [Mycoplasmataceae bacterium]|nr:hypothetical protein [Mycoplasmataceae bacterium]
MKSSKTYRIANANARIWMRILDTILCEFFIVLIDVLIFLNDKNRFDNINFSTWRYLIASLVFVSLNTIYFILIPYLNKKGTLVMLIAKYRFHNMKDNYLFNLFRHELFIWIIPSFIILIISIICATQNGTNALKFIDAISLFKWTWGFDWISLTAGILNVILVFCCLFNIGFFITTIVKNKKKTPLDLFSNVTIISSKPIYQNINKTNTNNTFTMPGMLTDKHLEGVEE